MATSNWKRAATVGDDALKNDHAGWLDHLQITNISRLDQASTRIVAFTVTADLLVQAVRYG